MGMVMRFGLGLLPTNDSSPLVAMIHLQHGWSNRIGSSKWISQFEKWWLVVSRPCSFFPRQTKLRSSLPRRHGMLHPGAELWDQGGHLGGRWGAQMAYRTTATDRSPSHGMATVTWMNRFWRDAVSLSTGWMTLSCLGDLQGFTTSNWNDAQLFGKTEQASYYVPTHAAYFVS